MAHAHEHAHAGHFDQSFLAKLIGHHQGAIDMGRVALQRAEHAELKQFAAQMVEMQQTEQRQIQQWLDQWYPDRAADPAGMDMTEMQTNLDALRTAQPFDRAFIDAIIPHHQQAVQMAQPALDQAEHAEVRTMAQDIITKQQQEIKQLQSWRATWYGA